MLLLNLLNIGTSELTIILAIIAVPVLLIIYCLVDILRSKFKNPLHKFLFLALILFAPMIGSIIYLIIRKDHIKQPDLQP